MRSRINVATAIAALLVAGFPGAVADAAPNGSARPAAAQQAAATGVVPRPDHIVVVVEENHAATQIVGNPAAPYINSLATQNANLTQSFAVTHPSQPNYIALFSGSTQGVTDDACPYSFTTPSLGGQLISAGHSFVGYSESQPSAGDASCGSAGLYARKHNPWVDFPAIPPASNQPFTAFPTDYSTLPTVSFVIPNLQNDMHDGTVAQGDTWLQNNLSGYVTWAKTHNSLFILTFDEDDNSAANQIATIFAGERVVPGSYPETVSHYNVLRTIEDAYGLTPLGASATSQPITDIWSAPAGDPPPVAAFTWTCTGVSCSFDGTGSTDDTAVANWSWDFGDGGSGTGSTVSHAYASANTYLVTLRVTDNQGATSAPISHSVVVTAPAGVPFVSDTYNRTVTNGLGSANVGGAWSTAGADSLFSVSPGAAAFRLSTAATQLSGFLPSVTRSDADVLTAVALDKVPAGGPVYLTVAGRQVSSGNMYAAKLLVNPDASVTMFVARFVGGAETALSSWVKLAGVVYAPGMVLDIRLQVTGTNPTVVRARAWVASGVEPTAWVVAGSDSSSALQAAGSVGLIAYLSGAATNAPVTVQFSNLTARPTAAPTNQPPVAAFTSSCAQLSCSFSGSGSSDPDGSVTGWSWTFGDGATGTGSSVSHSFAIAGTYSVTLTVTDNQGAVSAPVTKSVTVTAPPVNQAPVAAFTFSCQSLSCSFDGTGSTDDGSVTGWSWAFGDGSTGTGSIISHAFATAGTYSVTLTVTDNQGVASAPVTKPVAVTAPPVNQAPVAAFTSSCAQLTCSFSGSGSSDPDGTVTGWAWTFGDGASGTGVSPQHVYAAGGSYSVTLRATDNQGATSAPVSHSVTVTAPVGTPFVSDTFNRTVTNGLGSANVGGAWSTAGANSLFSVSSGSAAFRLSPAATQLAAFLPAVTRSDADVLVGVALDKVPVGGPVYVTVVGRQVSSGNMYAAKLLVNTDRSVVLYVARFVGGAETALSAWVKLAGVIYAPGMVLNLRVQVTGTTPTAVRARAWAASATEPAAWLVTGSDSSSGLQAAGSVGLIAYLSSAATNAPVTVRFSNLTAKPTAGA